MELGERSYNQNSIPTILFPIKLSDQFAFGELINFSLSFRLLVRSCTGGLYLSVLFHSYLSSISNCSPLIIFNGANMTMLKLIPIPTYSICKQTHTQIYASLQQHPNHTYRLRELSTWENFNEKCINFKNLFYIFKVGGLTSLTV